MYIIDPLLAWTTSAASSRYIASALVDTDSLSPDILDTWPNHVRRLLLITSTTVSGTVLETDPLQSAFFIL